MVIISILAIAVFDIILCIVEIPKMCKQKLFRELWAFSVLLTFGTVLAVMKSLDFYIYNPSDFIAWVYSPISGFMKSLLM